MKKQDLIFLRDLLNKIKPRDEQVEKAIAFVERDIKIYDSMKGQLKDQYDYFDYQ